MMTMADIASGLQSLTIVKNVLGAHRTLANFNEAQTALADVHMKLMAFKIDAMEAEEREATHLERIRELEEKVKKLEDWNSEKERYRLTEFAPGVPAYGLKPGMENNEPPHYLCANCFGKKEKSFLSHGSLDSLVAAVCGVCKSQFFLPDKKKKQTTIRLLS